MNQSGGYPPEVKQGLIADYYAGISKRQLRIKYRLHGDTVEKWIRQAEPPPDKKREVSETPPQIKSHKTVMPNIHGEIVLAIPDLHCPFQHPDALDFLKAVKAKYQPTKIVFLGDEIDACAFSRFPKNPDGHSAGKELDEAKAALIPFYVEFPDALVCVSNHTIRPHKLMREIGIPQVLWPTYSTMLNAPDGWVWKEHHIIDNVRYMHGDQGKGGSMGWTSNTEVYHQSVVVGHWHSKAGIFWDSLMFNVNSGCLIWTPSYAFDYARHSHKKPNLGCSIIIDGVRPDFIPMLVDADYRWTGVLL